MYHAYALYLQKIHISLNAIDRSGISIAKYSVATMLQIL